MVFFVKFSLFDMNFQASRKKRHAAALRLPGTVIAGTAWRQEKSCRLVRFRGSVAHVRDRSGSRERDRDNADMMGLAGKSGVFCNNGLDFTDILQQCISAYHDAHSAQHRNPAADRGKSAILLSAQFFFNLSCLYLEQLFTS